MIDENTVAALAVIGALVAYSYLVFSLGFGAGESAHEQKQRAALRRRRESTRLQQLLESHDEHPEWSIAQHAFALYGDDSANARNRIGSMLWTLRKRGLIRPAGRHD